MAESTDPLVDAFTTSFPIDRRLYAHDIAGSIAHCRMLARQKIITNAERDRIVRGLTAIEKEFRGDRFVALPSDEDVHMAIERRLIERVGAVGGKLHTARSRNDQVALDLRLYLREAIDSLCASVASLQRALADLARENLGVIMPGYTHLQPAQPVLFAHHLLAYSEMLERDDARLRDCRRRTNVLPLGAGALAGTTFPIDREYVAGLLDFDGVSQNSLDTVADRDFALEFLASGSILAMHLSRFAEEIVLWASPHFAFIELPDAFSTGSSMMPQKKNPDVAELVRGRTGRIYGDLVALLTTMKGLPLAYNRDMQEDKAPVFDAVDTLATSLQVLAAMVPRLRVRADRMRAAADAGYTLATELADYLAGRGIPFREAHGVVGAIVRKAIADGRSLSSLTLEELRDFSPAFRADVLTWLTPESAVARRRATGGTAPGNVRRRLRAKKLQG
jgi:argininosuccinate lyase